MVADRDRGDAPAAIKVALPGEPGAPEATDDDGDGGDGPTVVADEPVGSAP